MIEITGSRDQSVEFLLKTAGTAVVGTFTQLNLQHDKRGVKESDVRMITTVELPYITLKTCYKIQNKCLMSFPF